MSEVIVCTSAVRGKLKSVFETVCTFSMSLAQLDDLFDIEIRRRVKAAPLSQADATLLMNYAYGLRAGLEMAIKTQLCEVVCKGADGAIHQGANAAGTGLRWKGTDFLFTPIEVRP